MNYGLFLKERDDFFGRIYGLRLENLGLLRVAMEKSVEKTGLAKPFLVIPVGLTHQVLQKSFRKKTGVEYEFPNGLNNVWGLDNLSRIAHERWPFKSYFIRHGGHQEAAEGDEELKLFSAEKIWQQKIATMTTLEISQFSLEARINKIFVDTMSVSAASGSRSSDGYVVHVNFYDNKVCVHWDLPSYSLDHLRSRSIADYSFSL
jgi:hypothetical protein